MGFMFASCHADNCSGGQRKYPGSLNLDKRAISRGRIATGWQKEGARKGHKVKITYNGIKIMQYTLKANQSNPARKWAGN